MSPGRIARLIVVVPTVGMRDLRPLLAAISMQAAEVTPDTDVLVLDNGRTASASVRAATESAGAAYAHVATPGVASVRNAALDRATDADALVFIDDDERPADGWLAAHLEAADRYDADVVLGPVPVLLPPGSPRWLGDGSLLRDVEAGSFPDGPYAGPVNAGNTLLRIEVISRTGTRFETAYDTTGGEDTVFFDALRRQGAVVAWASGAVAHEIQDPDRLTVRGYSRRLFEAGQRAVLVERRLHQTGTGRIALRRSYRIARGIATTAGGAVTLRSDRAARGLGDIAFGAGSLTALAGREPHTYAR